MTTLPYERLKLTADGFENPRTYTGLSALELANFAAHLGTIGMLNSLIVTRDGLILAGQRRYRAIGVLFSWVPEGSEGEAGLRGCPLALDRFEIGRIKASVAQWRAHGIPVRIVRAPDLSGLALVDNLQREQLSGFEVARYLNNLHREGKSVTALHKLIGKSKTYVSRKLSAWAGAGEELREAWRRGDLPEEAVQDLAALPHEEQVRKLAGPIPRGRRGPAHRPGIDTIKAALLSLELHAGQAPGDYTAGVLDTLRWLTGQPPSQALGAIVSITEGP